MRGPSLTPCRLAAMFEELRSLVADGREPPLEWLHRKAGGEGSDVVIRLDGFFDASNGEQKQQLSPPPRPSLLPQPLFPRGGADAAAVFAALNGNAGPVALPHIRPKYAAVTTPVQALVLVGGCNRPLCSSPLLADSTLPFADYRSAAMPCYGALVSPAAFSFPRCRFTPGTRPNSSGRWAPLARLPSSSSGSSSRSGAPIAGSWRWTLGSCPSGPGLRGPLPTASRPCACIWGTAWCMP